MRKFSLLFLLLVVLLVLIATGRARTPLGHAKSAAVANSDDCNRKRRTTDKRACLAIGVVTSSVWDDGTVALAISVENHSAVPVRHTNVSAITVSSGKRTKPLVLPQTLGDLHPAQRAIMDAHFSGLTTPGSYELIVSGSYVEDGASRSFSLRQRINILRSHDGAGTPASATLTKHLTPGRRLRPAKIKPEHENPVGPPIPDGPSIAPLTAPVKSTHIARISGAGSSEVSIIRDVNNDHNTLLAPPDPSTAEGGGLVLSTGNTYLRLSLDDGANFTEIDPTTIFPVADGGLCCDQVMLFDRITGLYFWLLQYNSVLNPADLTKPGPNRLRLAWASPESIKANVNNWAFVDLQAQVLLKTADDALDYPDLAVTNNNVYVSVDVVDKRDPATATTSVSALIVARIPLAHITAGNSTVGVSWIGPDQSDDQETATGGRLTQSSIDAMYWAGHVDASKVKVFRWKDSDGKVDTHDVKVNAWCKAAADYGSLGPDGIQWIDSGRANISAVSNGARRPFSDPGQNHGEVWLPWNAGKDDGSGDCSKGKKQPYVKILRINDQSLEGIGEYHVWNPDIAFAYPALAASAAGEIGITVPYGGPSDFPASAIGFLNDFELFSIEDSDVTFSAAGVGTRIGDFYVVRNSGPDNVDLSTQGYAVRLVNAAMSTSCLVAPGCVYHVHYIQWGRPPVIIQ